MSSNRQPDTYPVTSVEQIKSYKPITTYIAYKTVIIQGVSLGFLKANMFFFFDKAQLLRTLNREIKTVGQLKHELAQHASAGYGCNLLNSTTKTTLALMFRQFFKDILPASYGYFASGLGGSFATILTAPLSVRKVRRMVSDYGPVPIKAWGKGLGTTMARDFGHMWIWEIIENLEVKAAHLKEHGETPRDIWLGHMLGNTFFQGLTSGIAASVITTPFANLANYQKKFGLYPYPAMQRLYQSEGFRWMTKNFINAALRVTIEATLAAKIVKLVKRYFASYYSDNHTSIHAPSKQSLFNHAVPTIQECKAEEVVNNSDNKVSTGPKQDL